MNKPRFVKIDFSNYTQNALEDSLDKIDRLKDPDNFSACLNEIERRKSAGIWMTHNEMIQEQRDKDSIFVLIKFIFNNGGRVRWLNLWICWSISILLVWIWEHLIGGSWWPGRNPVSIIIVLPILFSGMIIYHGIKSIRDKF